MIKTVSEKMGIKENARCIFINAPENIIGSIRPPSVEVASKLNGNFDFIHAFVKNQKELHKKFPAAKEHLRGDGSLWISWPKSGKENTDLNIKSVISIGYDYGMVESKCLSIDATWSALKFTRPIAGKVYNNLYGKLKTP